jgi:hypothetical protein
MRVFREPEEPEFGKDALTFALGAMGGLAVGLLLSRSRAPASAGRLGADLRDRARSVGQRARTVARRLQPARLRRMAGEQADLTQLEDAVLDAFLADGVLGERGVDIGAISPGIVELSGSVWTEEEADRAVALARRIPGVGTVVNRLDIEGEARRLDQTRRRLEDEGGGVTSLQHGTARTLGMGRRRQGRETDPDTQNDSHDQQRKALNEADLDQLEDEDIAWREPNRQSRPEVQRANRTRFDEDELDNQDPHGKHAPVTLDDQPQDLNTASRVGEGLKPGVELGLEGKDVPVKPHSPKGRDTGGGSKES